MPAVAVILTVHHGSAADLARSALSVSRQTLRDWELRVVDGGNADAAAAAATLAEEDPRVGGATDLASALAATSAPIVCFLDSGARFEPEHLQRVAAALADPSVRVAVAARNVEHGPRFSLVDRVGPDREPVASQVAVRRIDAQRPVLELVSDPGRLDLPELAVSTRFGELPPAPPPPQWTALVEISEASPPLSVKPQLSRLVSAGVPVVVALVGSVRLPSRLALGSWLREQGVAAVAADSAGAARAACVDVVDTPVATFLPAGWEIDARELSGMVELLGQRDACAVMPVARDAGGSILGAGFIWADQRSLPQRFLQGHPHADISGSIVEVAAPHPEGLTVRTEGLAKALRGDVPAPWWPIPLLHHLGSAGPVLVDGRASVAIPRFTPSAASGKGRRGGGKPLPARRASVLVEAAPADAVERSRSAMAALGWGVVGVDPVGEHRWRAVVARPVVRTEPVRARRWALKIGAPPGQRGDTWGDVPFAEDLAGALRSLGNEVVIDRNGSAGRATAYLDRVVLNIRGYQVVPRQPGVANLMWIISHPDEVEAEEMRAFDRVYAASPWWPATVRKLHGIDVVPLLQATNPDRFHPDVAAPDTGPDLLFVGNSRHQFRPIIADCRAAGLRPTVIGGDWEKFLPAAEIAAKSLPNAELPAAYRAAGIVLNDHWGDMVTHGFLNNRLFDAVACGARVVSDEVPGMEEVFGDAVAVYRTPSDLAKLCHPANRDRFGTDDQRRGRAARIAAEHSFLARARQLMADAARFPVLSD